MKYAVKVHRFIDEDSVFLVDIKDPELIRTFSKGEATEMVNTIGTMACEIVEHPYCSSKIHNCKNCDCGKKVLNRNGV
jgi:hypothetical protein